MTTLRSDAAGVGGSTFAGAVGQWAERTQARLRAVLRESAFDLAEAVIVGNRWSTGTPVDTGYARASWIVSLGAPSDRLPLGGRPAVRTPATAVAADATLAAVTAGLARWDPSQTLYLQNNTRYIAYLEYGLTVPKAGDTPPGWVGQAVRAWPLIVADATRRLRGAVAAGERL